MTELYIFKDIILTHIDGSKWLVIEANSKDAINNAIAHARATGSIGATWRYEPPGLTPIYATVERAKQP